MAISKPSLSKYSFLTLCMEDKALFSNAWLPETPVTLSYAQHFALRIIITLAAFLALPMILLSAGSIESVIAVFSVEASTTALIFSKIKSKSTTAWLPNDTEDEIVEFINIIGVAGVGTLLVIFLLT